MSGRKVGDIKGTKTMKIIEYLIKLFQILIAILFLFSNKTVKRLDLPNTKIWLKNFRRNFRKTLSSRACLMVCRKLKEFRESDIYIEKESGFKNNKNLIVICVIRNDIDRLKVFLEHYRKLRVNQFAFFDDKSTDGTREFLQEQNDVELFLNSKDFTSRRKVVWINRILAYYGFNRWYLVVDSDELLVYDDFENRPLTQFVNLLGEENITAASGMLIDLYPKESNSNHAKNKRIYDSIDYFDKNGYFQNKNAMISGGMRYRSFNILATLEKTPLFFLDNKTIFDHHRLFPFEKNFQKDRKHIALLHYKFLLTDYERYQERVDRNCMASNSKEYKVYVKKMDKTTSSMNFYDENISKKFTGSYSLIENNLMDRL